MKQQLKSLIPYGIAILIFYAFSAIYFAPSFEGKVIQSTDISSFQSTASEIFKFREIEKKNDNPEQILWTNSSFSGMPTYMISHPKWMNKTPKLRAVLGKIFPLRYPFQATFVGLIGIFFLLIALGVNKWLSIIGAFTYNFASFHYILLAHGHNAKIIVVGLYAYVLIGLILIFKHRKYFWGTLLFTLALIWQIAAAHIQMTYYLVFIASGYVITQAVVMIKAREHKELFKIIGMLVVAVVLALATNTGKMWTEYEYAKHTMRGGRELPALSNQEQTGDKAGLSNQYILAYSYDLGEAFSGIMPQAKGLYKPLPEKSSLYKALVKSGNAKVAKTFNKEGRYFYWGHQTASAAPFYYGVVMFALFILALFVVRGPTKYWLASIALIAFVLTIGKNSDGQYTGLFYGIQAFFIKYMPLYDKFRDVKNIVTIQSLAMVSLAFIGLSKIISGQLEQQEIKRAIKHTLIVVGALFLLIAASPTILGDTASARDAYMFKGWPQQIITAMQETRAEAIRADAFRGLLFSIITLVIIYLFTVKKINFLIASIALLGIISIDMLPQDLKALNHDNFINKKQNDNFVQKSKADEIILKDKDPYYRVFKFGDSFNDAFTSKYHKSIGGYSAAKLSRYQDIIERRIMPFMKQVSSAKTQEEQARALFTNNTMNMLNTKYFITNPNGQPIQNPMAYGNAWFADKVTICDGALEEITALNHLKTKNEIVTDKQFADQIKGKIFELDSTANIALASYHPNTLIYNYSSSKEQLVVFSEIYYAPNGWQAYIDGKKTDHFRANYILRAMVVPAGKHTITFKFEPKSYFTGTKISMASSYLLILILLGGIVFEIYKLVKKKD